MGRMIKVRAAKSVYYGKIIRDPNLPGGKVDTHKLYLEGAILEIDEDHFTDAALPLPGGGNGAMGSYFRVDANAVSTAVPPALQTDAAKSAEAKALAIVESAKLEAKRIVEEAMKAAQQNQQPELSASKKGK